MNSASRPPRTPQPQTRSQQDDTQDTAPALPHERDESAHDTQSAQEPSMQRMGRLAHQDAVRGAPDTSRSVETDATYHQLREGAQSAGGNDAPKKKPGAKAGPGGTGR